MVAGATTGSCRASERDKCCPSDLGDSWQPCWLGGDRWGGEPSRDGTSLPRADHGGVEGRPGTLDVTQTEGTGTGQSREVRGPP